MRKLMILDSHGVYAHSLQAVLAEYCEVIVCNQYDIAAEIISEVRPDYMVIDFTASEFEGFTVLRSALAMGANPAVIGVVQGSFFYELMCSREKNICSTVYRPVDYMVVANRITCMMELPQEQLVPTPTRTRFVEFMLESLGIPTTWEGGKNLLTIIPLAADHPEMKVTKHLYPAAVMDSGDPAENVERNIRKAIEHGYINGDPKAWARYFPADENGKVRKPSNAVLIGLLSEILKQQNNLSREGEKPIMPVKK